MAPIAVRRATVALALRGGVAAVGVAFALASSGCGTVRTLTRTVTVRHTVTETVTRTTVRQAPVAIYVPEVSGGPQYKPTEIDISADAADIWGITRWISYGGSTAKAIAVTWHNDCNPDCASGHGTQATTTILLSDPTPCDGVPAYSVFEVMKSSNESVASDGEEQDLRTLCGGQ